MGNFRKVFDLLSSSERNKVFYLLLMIIIMALLETLGVASILPFIAVLTNPELIQTNLLINKIFTYSEILGVETNQQFLFFLGLSVFFILVFSLIFKTFLIYFQLRFSSMCEYGLSKRVLKSYLNQPYSWFLNRHSADLGKTILSEVGLMISKGLKPILNLITYGMIAFAILVLLIINNPMLALIIGFILGMAYIFIYKFTKNYLTRIGRERLKANQGRFTIVSEAFGAVKEIKLGGLEQTYIERFSHPARVMARHIATSSIISNVPRFILEAVAFGSILLFLMIRYLQSIFY